MSLEEEEDDDDSLPRPSPCPSSPRGHLIEPDEPLVLEPALPLPLPDAEPAPLPEPDAAEPEPAPEPDDAEPDPLLPPEEPEPLVEPALDPLPQPGSGDDELVEAAELEATHPLRPAALLRVAARNATPVSP